jgi:hypothetical protein
VIVRVTLIAVCLSAQLTTSIAAQPPQSPGAAAMADLAALEALLEQSALSSMSSAS